MADRTPTMISFYDGIMTVVALCPNPAELVWGVENDLKPSFDKKATAPLNWQWKKSTITPIDLNVEFIQGISPGLGQNQNPSYEKMEAMVRGLINMAMPSYQNQSVRIIRISAYRNGSAWFSRQGILRSAKAVWEGPFDDQGRPRKALVSLSMEAHYGAVGHYGTATAARANMPQRGRFRFNKG